ncbi:MAG: PDZ domain-containing protein, partial [Gammaproteobacteria bacterium]|nr:PDZ domain-containing protein [Gammaproteobacteria bacterium]
FNGIGFAIPIDLAISVLEQIIRHGYVVRGWLGVGGQALTPLILEKLGLANIAGILVTDVDSGGPGDSAGLKAGDIITHINGQPITSAQDILNIVAAGRPGDKFEIAGLRQRESFKLDAILGQRPLVSQ